MSDDLIRRSDVLAAIEAALNNATADLFDAYSAVKAIPAATPTVQKAALREIDLSKSDKHNHPDIKTDGTIYLVKIGGGWFAGPFTRQWYGLSFSRWGNAGAQFDAPGYNLSRWERVLEFSADAIAPTVQEALRRMSPRLDMLDCETVLQAADALQREALAAEARPAVRVKPLVWEEHDGKSYRQANCVLGQYQVAWLGEFECWQLSRPKKAEQEWKEAFSRHSNKDDAKAAAQADYETRILAAVEAVDLTPVREALARIESRDSYIDATIRNGEPERKVAYGEFGAIARAALVLIDGEKGND